MERKISSIKKTEAKHITSLLKCRFKELHVSNNPDLVRIRVDSNTKKEGFKEYIWIHFTGKVTFQRTNGNPDEIHYEDINTLPITDYMRKVGFKFKYK